jgi:hypothetical protein
MLRQNFRLRGNDFREPIFQHLANSQMQFATPATQQRAVGNVLYERVFKSVIGIGWRTSAE